MIDSKYLYSILILLFSNLNSTEASKSESLNSLLFSENIEEVQKALDAGADINFQNEFGNTPLIHATIEKRIEIVKLLTEKKANINIQNKSGMTALMEATRFYTCMTPAWVFIDIIKFLIKAKADLSIKNNDGKTALQMAIRVDKYNDLIDKHPWLIDLLKQAEDEKSKES